MTSTFELKIEVTDPFVFVPPPPKPEPKPAPEPPVPEPEAAVEEAVPVFVPVFEQPAPKKESEADRLAAFQA